MGRALKAYGSFLLLLVIVPVAAGYGYAWHWLRREEAAWAKDFEPMPALIARHPKADASEGAKRLDDLSRPLEIAFLGSVKADDSLKAFGEHVSKHQNATEAGIQPASASLVGYLGAHAAELDAIQELLLSGQEISFPIDLETRYDAPIPSLLAQRYLQNLLLVRALEAARSRRAAEASRALEASWALNRTMVRRPEVLPQLIAIAIAGMQEAVLRCMPEAPAAWNERLGERGFRAGMLRALQIEAYLFGSLGRGFIGITDLAEVQEGRYKQEGALNMIMRVLTAPYLRLSVASYSEHLRAAMLQLKQRNPCDVDSGKLSDEAAAGMPRWNTIGRIAMPSLIRAWHSTVTADLDAERTRVVIDARRGAVRASAIVASEVCPGLTWEVKSEAPGTLSVGPRGMTPPKREPEGWWTFRVRSKP